MLSLIFNKYVFVYAHINKVYCRLSIIILYSLVLNAIVEFIVSVECILLKAFHGKHYNVLNQ